MSTASSPITPSWFSTRRDDAGAVGLYTVVMRREMEKPVSRVITCLAAALATAGCGFHYGSVKENGKVEVTVTEQAVRTIALEGDITQKWAEVSGLAWYGDNLIIFFVYNNCFQHPLVHH